MSDLLEKIIAFEMNKAIKNAERREREKEKIMDTMTTNQKIDTAIANFGLSKTSKSKKSGTKKSTMKKSTAKKSVAKKLATKKSVTKAVLKVTKSPKKLAVKKSVVKKSAAKKSSKKNTSEKNSKMFNVYSIEYKGKKYETRFPVEVLAPVAVVMVRLDVEGEEKAWYPHVWTSKVTIAKARVSGLRMHHMNRENKNFRDYRFSEIEIVEGVKFERNMEGGVFKCEATEPFNVFTRCANKAWREQEIQKKSAVSK